MPSSGVQTCALRSEEHTSELQSHDNLVCRLLLDKNELFRSEEHTSELQSHDNLLCRLLLEKNRDGGGLPGHRPLCPVRGLAPDAHPDVLNQRYLGGRASSFFNNPVPPQHLPLLPPDAFRD